MKYLFVQWLERPLPSCLERDVAVHLDSGKVICLIGIRRTGKTFLLFDFMQKLISSGVDRRQIIYLNFDDDRIYPVTSNQLDLILQAHGELYPDYQTQKRYIFLDEVQAVPGWERYVRRLYDTENVQIFVTGSSSHLLAGELAPALRGRSVFIEVFPLSFSEFLRFKKIELHGYSRKSESKATNALEDYISWGGLPEIVLAEPAMRPLILEEYISLLYYKDMVERFDIRNEPILRLILKSCCSQPASLISVHRLYRDIKSMGFKTSKNTVYDYLHYLQEARILFALPLYTRSVRKQEQNPKKYHLIDVGLARAYRPDPDADKGHKLENLVYLREQRKRAELYYYKNGHELDLVITDNSPCYVNTAWSITSPGAVRREEAAMRFGRKMFPHGEGTLVCHELPASGIDAPFRIMPAWKYLLDQDMS